VQHHEEASKPTLNEDEETEGDFELVPADTGEAPEEMEAKEPGMESAGEEEGVEAPKEPPSESDGRTIIITRAGEKYHLEKGCKNLTNYAHYERFPCKECEERTKEVLDIKESSSSNRSETALFISTKDQKYHHPSCERLWGSRSKDRRVRCLDCESDELTLKWARSRAEEKNKEK